MSQVLCSSWHPDKKSILPLPPYCHLVPVLLNENDIRPIMWLTQIWNVVCSSKAQDPQQPWRLSQVKGSNYIVGRVPVNADFCPLGYFSVPFITINFQSTAVITLHLPMFFPLLALPKHIKKKKKKEKKKAYFLWRRHNNQIFGVIPFVKL